MARVPSSNHVATRKPRASKPKAPSLLATLEQDDLNSVISAHNLLANKNLELNAIKHFLSKINDEIQDKYELPNNFVIDFSNGSVTEFTKE